MLIYALVPSLALCRALSLSVFCLPYCELEANLYYNLPISVCLFVCLFFWPPSHGPISNLSTYLDSLWHSGPNKSITEVIRAQTKKFLHSYGYGSIAIWMSVCLSEWFYTLTKCLSVCPNYSIPYKSLSVCPNDSIPLLKVCLSVRIILCPIYSNVSVQIKDSQ